MLARKAVALAFVGSSIAGFGFAGPALAAPCNSPYVVGDVFASVGSSTVNVFTPTGTLVCSLNDTSGATFTTGSGFDAAGNFYVTNFSTGTVSKFDNSGTLLNSAFFTSGNTPESVDNQSTGFYAGTSLVGGPGGATINQYNTATGTQMHSFSVTGGNGTGGTDWVDTYNPTTGQIIYDGEGSAIRSAILNSNGTVTQLADFTSAASESTMAGNGSVYALRTIPSGTFAGDVLAADSTVALLLDSSGNIIKTYTLPGNDGSDFALNLDPNGTDFWTADPSGTIWEVNIATGAIDNQFNSGSGATFGLAVFGEIQQGGGGGPTPVVEPSSLILLAGGLVGLQLLRLRRKTA